MWSMVGSDSAGSACLRIQADVSLTFLIFKLSAESAIEQSEVKCEHTGKRDPEKAQHDGVFV